MIHLRFVLSGSDLPLPKGPHERLVVVGNHPGLGLSDPLAAPDLLHPTPQEHRHELHDEREGDDPARDAATAAATNGDRSGGALGGPSHKGSADGWSLSLSLRIDESLPLPFALGYNFVLVSEQALIYHGDDKEVVLKPDHEGQTITVMEVWDREKQHKFFPVLDERTIVEIERQAAQVSSALTQFTHTLQTSLQTVTSVTLQNVVAFERSITHMSEAVQSTVQTSEDFVKKCIQLDEDLKYMDSLALQIRDIKKHLDFLEAAASRLA